MANLFNTMLLVSPEIIGRNLYWVGGTASWNGTAASKWALTSGGSGGQVEPTSIDNVFFDANSGVVTVTAITTIITCRNIDFTGFTGTFTGSATGSIYGSWTFGAGMTQSYTGTLTFRSTYPGRTITCNGKTFASGITFDGIGGAWTLQDSLTNSSNISLNNGFLNTNNQSVSITSFSSNNSGIRTLILGTSTITCSSGWTATTSGLNLSVASSTINVSGTVAFNSKSATYGTVNFTGGVSNFGPSLINGDADGAITFGTLSRTTNTYSVLQISVNIIVTSSLTFAGGNANTQRLGILNTLGTSTPVTITCNGSIALSNTDFLGITGTGSATWTGTSLGDCGGNSNITTTSPVTRFAVCAAGSNDFMADIWSTSSGGATGQTRPLPQDTVTIDGNSFGAISETLTIGSYRLPTLDFTNATHTPTLSFNGAITTYFFGDLKFIAGMVVSGTSGTTFQKQSGTQTLTSGTQTNTSNIAIKTLGTFVLGDDMIDTGTIGMAYTSGTFNDNNHNVTSTTFVSSSTLVRAWNKGNGTYTITGTGNAWSITGTTNLTFTDAGTIKFTNNSSTGKNFIGGSLTYNNVWNATAGTGILTFIGSNTFKDLKSDASRSIKFTGGTTTTISTMTLGITCTIASTVGTYNIVSNSGTPIASTGTVISNCAFSGATWTVTAGTDGGGNSGITFV